MSTITASSVDRPITIAVNHVSKSYHLYRSTVHRLACMLGLQTSQEAKWALHDVSFSVCKGEMVGLIGSNGAGKSTLLKLIAGATAATSGTIVSSGRIAALLELGLGFHPEWTGRQNVEYYLRLHGMRHADVERLMPEIEGFADVGIYFDQPFRTCSTGMGMRISFAAAVLLPCETLIIDEAMAVGDTAFAQKCFAHIARLRGKGVTIFLVTHRIDLVIQLCSRALVLQQGRLAFDGLPDKAAHLYYQQIFGGEGGEQKPPTGLTAQSGDLLDVFGVGGAAITQVDIHGGIDGGAVFCRGSTLRVVATILFDVPFATPVFGMSLRTVEGVALYQTNSDLINAQIGAVQAHEQINVDLDIQMVFPPTTLFLDLSIGEMVDGQFVLMQGRVACAEITIVGAARSVGLIDLDVAITFRRVGPTG